MDLERRFIVTPTLVAMNVACFLAIVSLGVSPTAPQAWDLLPFGANFGGYIVQGEWWRLVTSAFLHFGVLHLGFNMWCLWSLGRLAEPMFGNGRFLLVYVLTALGGSAASLLWHPYVVSAGASGAVFGLAGALAAFLYLGHIHLPPGVARRLLTSIVFFIGINLAIGASLPGIDNAGHLGGLVVGAVLGAALRYRHVFYVSAAAVLASLVALAPLAKRRTLEDARVLETEAVLLASKNETTEMLDKLEAAIEQDPTLIRSHAMAAELYISEGRYDEAADAARRAVQLDPQFEIGQRLLGTALYLSGRYEEAVEELRIAVEMKRDELVTYVRLSSALRAIGRAEEAVAVLEEALTWAPESAGIHSEIGLAHHDNGDYDLAVASIRKAVEVEPQHAEHYNRLSLVLAVAGEGDEALDAVETALELAPGASHILDSLGTVRFYRGELEQAIRAYRDAVSIDPEQAVFHYNLSVALRDHGDASGAAEAYGRALELDPDFAPPQHGGPKI